MNTGITEYGQKYLKEILISYHIAEEIVISAVCILIAIRAFRFLSHLEFDRDRYSRVFLFGAAFSILGLSSLIHATIHSYDLNLNLLYHTLIGYCFALLLLIIAISAERPGNKRFLPFLYFLSVIFLVPGTYNSFPIFSDFRPLVWIFVAYLSGIVCMLYIATYYRTNYRRFIYSAIGHLLICASAIFLFFPSDIGSPMWLYGHLLRPFGFIVLLFSTNREELSRIGGSILYRVLSVFSIIASIPLFTFGIAAFYENIHHVQVVNKRMLIFILLLITLVSALLFALALIIRLIKPIIKLKESVDTLVESDFNTKIEINTNDEIGELGQAFNHMVVKLKHAMREQDRLSRLAATGELAATLAHEIKNPLNAIGGAASYIKENFKGTLINEFLTIISSEVSRINKLTTTLLNFAKPLKPQFEKTDINRIIRETVELIGPEIKESNVELKTDLEEKLPDTKCDPSQIKQIVINLLLNALDAVNGNGVIELQARKNRNMIEISVKDNGTGIKPEDLPQIFNPFYTTKTRGTGLGLAISKKIATEHNGDLVVESHYGKGSTFTLMIPIR